MTIDQGQQLAALDAEFTAEGKPVRAWRRGARNMRVKAVGLVRRARGWRLHLAAPGLAGAALISAGAGGIANYCWHGIGVWVGLGVAGLFALRLDSRMG